jgi:hypothetical protein
VVWSSSFDPHATTVPLFFKTTVCNLPAAIAVTPLKPAGMMVWSKSFDPQATTVPLFFKATV